MVFYEMDESIENLDDFVIWYLQDSIGRMHKSSLANMHAQFCTNIIGVFCGLLEQL